MLILSSINQWWAASPHFRGAFWKVSSYLSFAAINGVVRYLSQSSESLGQTPLPSYEVAFFQNLFGLVFLIPWILQHGPKSLKTKFIGLHTFRIALSAAGVVLWYISLSYIPLAEAVGLMFLGPLITTMGAWYFLRERIGLERGLAIGAGFVGGAIITQKFFHVDHWSFLALLPVCAAACFSGATLMVRKLSQHDSSQLIVTYLLLFMAPALLLPTLLWGHLPYDWQWPWLFLMGMLAASAHLCFCKAYETAEVSYLIPYGFTKWFASAAIGFLAFAEIPTTWTTIGAFVLMTAIVILSFAEARKRERLKPSSV